ncbi:MAG TPA: 3-isopropylmalate dehydratase small subunit [Dictyoglomaceae bacterium]|nr:3-isopropylmalate dehydratase small subunit [Dictyoglomaceae bacterium]HOL39671.1 3-isopropylmalate dehydratase small subunit [Dictyoglomaceae bacterium]HOP94793.1 3-isopropylmalate dehydratase small subunit [Dictyoglomaceae bacterium]HPP16060.1 3-isopropylmalate dehydratase small subunit [Dictyoglomaceae bacterium]HPU43312.1 3-isopropylmalate dehydratase small subunit [Dictyoglomaceae bacterium]
MIIKGKVHKFGDDINTDYIISGKYKFKSLDFVEMSKHLFEDLDPNFYKKITPGDIIVAGKNFGCGSSREQAPLVIKYAGIGLVIAKSFARIFYRNSINVGLPLLEADTDEIDDGDELEVDLFQGKIYNKTKDKIIYSKSTFPEIMVNILQAGGLVEYLKKEGDFKI